MIQSFSAAARAAARGPSPVSERTLALPTPQSCGTPQGLRLGRQPMQPKAQPVRRRSVTVRAGFLQEVAQNEAIVSATAGFLAGQLLKPFTSGDASNQWNWKLLFKSGGMPSSHSATVCGMTTGIYFQNGGADSTFALSIIFACIVMYDAQGVRRAVGKQAEVLNTLVVPILAKPEQETRAIETVGNGSAVSAESRVPVGVREASLHSEDKTSNDRVMLSGSPSEAAQVNGGILSTGLRGPISPPEGLQRLKRGPLFWNAAKSEPSVQAGDVVEQEIGELEGWRHIPLKESVGHTKRQVVAGAFTGWILGLLVHHVLFV